MQTYETKQFNFKNLEGISQEQIDQHLGLYAGYVKNTNGTAADLAKYAADPDGNARALSEISRRFGFEFNGMRLHEYYFDQWTDAEGSESTALQNTLAKEWGSFDTWQAEFTAMGKMRGIGWVLLVQDEINGNLHNIWVSDHELGHLARQKVLVAMDVWEHAYMVDHPASGRGAYIEAFFKNLNWGVIEERF